MDSKKLVKVIKALVEVEVQKQHVDFLENQFPKKLPLDSRAETPIRADKSAIAYRRWLSQKGLTYGVIVDNSSSVKRVT